MSQQLGKTLKALQTQRKEEKLKKGWKQVPEWVFVTETGEPLDGDNLRHRVFYKLLAKDSKLRSKIKEAAAEYGIDPMHVVGAIVGEHTYNVDAYDRLQTYYVKAIAYLDQAISFSYGGESVDDFVQRPEFAACNGAKGSYELWTCREMVWDTTDANFTAIQQGFFNNTPVEFAIMDGAIATAGSQGLRATMSITNFSRSEALEEAIMVSVTAKPTYAANAPSWMTIA